MEAATTHDLQWLWQVGKRGTWPLKLPFNRTIDYGLTSSSTVVIICTAYFNIQNCFILPTQGVYEFYELLTSKVIILPKNRGHARFFK
jgi:hypothetical protein